MAMEGTGERVKSSTLSHPERKEQVLQLFKGSIGYLPLASRLLSSRSHPVLPVTMR